MATDKSSKCEVVSTIDDSFSIPARIWLWLCIIINLVNVITCLTNSYWIYAILAFLLVVANFLLLYKMEIKYFVLLVAVIVFVSIFNIYNNQGIFTSLLGLLNPLITYIFTAKYWKLKGSELNGLN